jgi:hypothetical protein
MGYHDGAIMSDQGYIDYAEEEIRRLNDIIAWKEKKIAYMTHIFVCMGVNNVHRGSDQYIAKIATHGGHVGRKEYRKFLDNLHRMDSKQFKKENGK